ncbi:hypothetical protein GOBAR_AA19396 [Gossypium barbadense]|uniref:Uncharacterized protein n=1 Tax=Gossypium barbadense TaxID=3634 RepID=A0A2P5XD55_GOSBA|nr:hypothetical protein GOBAR_AA19396 [Gossypium barbadense]
MVLGWRWSNTKEIAEENGRFNGAFVGKGVVDERRKNNAIGGDRWLRFLELVDRVIDQFDAIRHGGRDLRFQTIGFGDFSHEPGHGFVGFEGDEEGGVSNP